MSKCSHGLTSAECYVCASPKYGETLRFKGHRLPPDDTALLRQALSTLEGWANHGDWVWPESALEQAKRNTEEAITALKERLGEKT
jgi:hypothetical protein